MLNSVQLIGRFTRDPELRTTQSGISTCSFTIAVDRNFVRQGEERKADFINCVAWRQTAEFITRYFKKGNLVALEGSIQTRTWDDNEGKRHYVTEVIVDRTHFVESKRDSGANAGGYNQGGGYANNGGYGQGGNNGGYDQGGYNQNSGYGGGYSQSAAPAPQSEQFDSFGGLGDPISPIGTEDDLPF